MKSTSTSITFLAFSEELSAIAGVAKCFSMSRDKLVRKLISGFIEQHRNMKFAAAPAYRAYTPALKREFTRSAIRLPVALSIEFQATCRKLDTNMSVSIRALINDFLSTQPTNQGENMNTTYTVAFIDTLNPARRMLLSCVPDDEATPELIEEAKRKNAALLEAVEEEIQDLKDPNSSVFYGLKIFSGMTLTNENLTLSIDDHDNAFESTDHAIGNSIPALHDKDGNAYRYAIKN